MLRSILLKQRVLKLLLYFCKTVDPPVRTRKSTVNSSQCFSCKTAKCAAYKIIWFEFFSNQDFYFSTLFTFPDSSNTGFVNHIFYKKKA